LAVHWVQRVAPNEASDLARRVLQARPAWTSNFDGIQYTLGSAWYAHLEEDREDAYFEGSAASDLQVEKVVPGLQEHMRRLVSQAVQGPVVQRPDWCGAGVHIFPAGGACASDGGDLHCDDEGLTEEQLAQRVPALTCVLMLQAPESGGGLRVWEQRYAPGEEPLVAPDAGELVHYGPGDLVVIDSYRLHRIMPFGGAKDRVSATLHAVWEDGVWQTWF
jgi:hypothetical protein